MTTITTAGTPGVSHFSRIQLLRTAQLFASDPGLRDALDVAPAERSWRRLDATAHLEIWLLGWPAGSSTGWHDHLSSEGAFAVAEGALVEETRSGGAAHERLLVAGEGHSFGRQHVHHVANPAEAPALSVHVYSPSLEGTTRYAVLDGLLRVTGVEQAGGQS
jgi:quercetin dioxygenase-like cupin family protein